MSSHLWDYAKEGEDDDRQRASSVCDDTNDSTRFENLSHKLQRSFQEKNMMLGEIQSLKKQLRDVSNSSVAIDAEREAWNRLIDANVRSGIMACIWCMKAQVVKITAMAFHKWKTSSLLDMSKKVLLNNMNNMTNRNSNNYNNKSSNNADHKNNCNNNNNNNNNFSNNFNNIPFDPNGRDATMEAAAAAAQYFQQLMLQIPLNGYSNIKINIPTGDTEVGRGGLEPHSRQVPGQGPGPGQGQGKGQDRNNDVHAHLSEKHNEARTYVQAREEPHLYKQMETQTQVQEEPHHRQPLRGRSNTATPRKYKNDNLNRVPFGRFHTNSPSPSRSRSRSRSASPIRTRSIGPGSPPPFHNQGPGSPAHTRNQGPGPQTNGTHKGNQDNLNNDERLGNNSRNGVKNTVTNINNGMVNNFDNDDNINNQNNYQNNIDRLNIQIQGINRNSTYRPEPAPFYMSPTASFSSKKKRLSGASSGSRPGIKVGSISSKPSYNLSTHEKNSKNNNQHFDRNIYSLKNKSFDLSEFHTNDNNISMRRCVENDLNENIYEDSNGYNYYDGMNNDHYDMNTNINRSNDYDSSHNNNNNNNNVSYNNNDVIEDKNFKFIAQKGISQKNQNQNENKKYFKEHIDNRNSVENKESHRYSNKSSASILVMQTSGKVRNEDLNLDSRNLDPRSTGKNLGLSSGKGNLDPRSHVDKSAQKNLRSNSTIKANGSNGNSNSNSNGGSNGYINYNGIGKNDNVIRVREEEEDKIGYNYDYRTEQKMDDIYTMPQFKRYVDQMGTSNHIQR